MIKKPLHYLIVIFILTNSFIGPKIWGQYGENVSLKEKQANSFLESKNYVQALSLYKDILTYYQNNGGQADDLGYTLNNIGKVLMAMKDYSQAIKFYNQAKKCYESMDGNQGRSIARMDIQLARCSTLIGNITDAKNFIENAIAIQKEQFGENDEDYHTSRELLNSLNKRLKSSSSNINVIQQDNNQTSQEAYDLNEKAMTLYKMGKGKEALPLFKKALVIDLKTLGLDNQDTASAFMNLGSCYLSVGDGLNALPNLEKALSIRRKIFGNDNIDTATALLSLGGAYMVLGQHAKALPYYEEAQKLFEKICGLDSVEVSAALVTSATTYASLQNIDRAIPLLERALKIQEKQLGPNHSVISETLMALGASYYGIGKHEVGLPLLERAMAIVEKNEGMNSSKTAAVASVLGISYMGELGSPTIEKNNEKSLNYLQRALNIYQKNNDYHELGLAYCSLGQYYWTVQDFNQALKYYELGLENDKIYSQNYSPDVVRHYINNETLKYISNGSNAVNTNSLNYFYDGNLNNLPSILTMDVTSRSSWQQNNLYYPMIELLNVDNIARIVLHLKGAILDSIIEDKAFIKKLGENTPQSIEFQYCQFRLGKLAFSKNEKDREEVNNLKKRIDEIYRFSSRKRSAIGQSNILDINIVEKIKNSLTDGSALIEIVHYKDPDKNYPWPEYYGVLLIGQDGKAQFIPIKDGPAIDAAVKNFRKAITSGDEKALAGQMKILSEKLWIPIGKNLPDKTTKLFIGGDGNLNFLSFAALLAPDGRFLAEHYEIAYVGCGRDLTRPVSTIPEKNIALFADPLFDRKVSPLSTNALSLRSCELDEFGKIVLPSLPGTRSEEAVVEREAKSNGWSSSVHLGEEASKSSIISLKSPGILHLATHGFYLNSLQKGGDGERGMKVVDAVTIPGLMNYQIPKIDPMNASGLALTGAQATLKAWADGKVPDPKDDGILTAQEVAGLDLDGTWLVTLSACDTGAGEARSGEGVFGLRRAFMMAGAQNLLMTLWPVSDDFTPTFMADFYKEALTTKDAPGALAHVQRDWLVKLRKEKGLLAAVRDAGPFAMVVMANPNAKPSSSDTNKSTNAPTPDPRANIQPLVAPAPTVVQSKGGSVLEFQNALVKADAGDAYAQAVVAIYYCLGYKTDKNLDRASEYASKSATQGNPLGVYVLGSMIAQGNGVEKDPEKGVKLKMQATEGLKNMEIDPYALASLGAMALRGEGESKDMKKAASLYKQSADLGYAPAQIIYGVMLSKGVGIPKNSTKSNFYLQKAKEQNFTPPQQAQN